MKKITLILLILLCTGCSQQTVVDVWQQAPIDEELLQKITREQALTKVQVIALADELIVATQVQPLQKYKKKKIEGALRKDLEKSFQNKTIFVSTDFKLFYEIEKLMKERPQEIEKEIEHLKKLAKEET